MTTILLSKDRDRQYHNAAKVRKLRKSRFKGIFEQVIEPVESGKLGPVKRTPKVNMDCLGYKMQANSEENWPVRGVSVPA
jgi:hypothetical protein